MSKFNKGAAVIVTTSNGDTCKGGFGFKGSFGFIEYDKDPLYAGVYFPNFNSGHDLGGLCEFTHVYHCWWIKWDDLELQEEEN